MKPAVLVGALVTAVLAAAGAVVFWNAHTATRSASHDAPRVTDPRSLRPDAELLFGQSFTTGG
jgi:hypothetical protein